MPERNGYVPGTFSWIDLQSLDVDQSQAFYGAVLGWRFRETPIPGQGVSYFTALTDGKAVAGLGPMPQQAREAGAPPSWTSYVSVEDAETTAARAGELGGTVLMPAMTVMDQGRLAIIADPQGAVFGLWQPLAHRGAELVNEPGTLAWNELRTGDVPAAERYYGELFGWTFADLGPQGYRVIRVGEHDNGGIMATGETWDGVPPHWGPYLAVDDADDVVARATEHGGSVVLAAFDGPPGRMAFLADPQGAQFAVVAMTEPAPD